MEKPNRKFEQEKIAQNLLLTESMGWYLHVLSNRAIEELPQFTMEEKKSYTGQIESEVLGVGEKTLAFSWIDNLKELTATIIPFWLRRHAEELQITAEQANPESHPDKPSPPVQSIADDPLIKILLRSNITGYRLHTMANDILGNQQLYCPDDRLDRYIAKFKKTDRFNENRTSSAMLAETIETLQTSVLPFWDSPTGIALLHQPISQWDRGQSAIDWTPRSIFRAEEIDFDRPISCPACQKRLHPSGRREPFANLLGIIYCRNHAFLGTEFDKLSKNYRNRRAAAKRVVRRLTKVGSSVTPQDIEQICQEWRTPTIIPGITLTAEALSSLEKGDHKMKTMWLASVEEDVPLTIPTIALAKWWPGEDKIGILTAVTTEPLLLELAKLVAEVAKQCAMGVDIVDIGVMASAAQRGDCVYTTDIQRLMELQSHFPGVQIFQA